MAIASADLSVCIVNYRTPRLVTDCLATLLPDLPPGARVVIADNASGDGSESVIEAWLAEHDADRACLFLRLATNGGFAAGYNAAMRGFDARLYLLLNSDTLVRPGAIGALLEAARRRPEDGLFSPRLEWPDGQAQESCFRDHSPSSELIAAARTSIVTRMLRHAVVALPPAKEEISPEWTSFAAVLIRREVLEAIGYLDEGFFLYFEDCEFCWRARRNGIRIRHVPTARIVHLRGGSSDVKSRGAALKRLPRYYYESRARYFRLRYGLFGPGWANTAWLAGRAVSWFREVFLGKARHLPQHQAADIWTNILRPLQQRKRP